jgi:pimeloyl-ACP methyl ester carboxylesterase
MTARSTNLVLVPGLACTEDLFAEQIASLRGEVIISAADHARHDTMSAIARAVLATAPNRFALCGLSMGGAIAFEMVRQAPDRIERLALLDTSALTDTPEQTERRLKLIAMAQTGEFKCESAPRYDPQSARGQSITYLISRALCFDPCADWGSRSHAE